MLFECHMVDFDTDDGWIACRGYDHEDAASEYAERCDSDSGGELFQDTSSRCIVHVRRNEADTIHVFEMSIEFAKVFYASEVQNGGKENGDVQEQQTG